jgi:hypothetical protein
MNTNLDEFETELPKRSTFLTVLCVLTFIGSGWAVFSNIYAYKTAGTTVQIFEKSVIIRRDSAINNDNVAGPGDKKGEILGEKMLHSVSKMMTVDNIHKSALGGFIAALFTLGGAILMFYLKRIGFYLYIFGVIIGLLIPLYLYGSNLMAVGMSVFSGFFGLVFIALYALNLKSMK